MFLTYSINITSQPILIVYEMLTLLLINNPHEEVEGLKRKRRDLTLVVEARAQQVVLARQLKEVERCLIES